jgi:rSAM/selenodomain-associated transferase 2/rSAM/selenodomain-associated transferase 1
MRYALRIVIPVLNEGAALTAKLAALQSLRAQGAEIVLVDGGSLDESCARAQPWVDHLISSPAGRARQMNAGAACTTQSTAKTQADALLFLHADTQLPPNAYALILHALEHQPWGRFDVQLESNDPRLRLVSAMMNLRSRLTGIATGDQAMFVKTALFQTVGGFPDQPLMEDIELSKRLKKHASPACLREKVITSARKWERDGVWNTVALMWRLRWAYFWGASPSDLALAYGYTAAPPDARADVAILAKAPVPGLAKTRLIPLLGAKGAARQQRQFLLQSLHTAQQAKLGRITLWCAPHAQHPAFRALARAFGLACLPQLEGDLGERMRRCMDTHFAQTDAPPLLIIGTDCAVLAPGHLQEAARKLLTHDACLIPAEDGGYVLLGLRRPVPEVLEQIDWSTDRVLAQTRARLQQAGATWAELPALWDIDEPADWQRWQALRRLESIPS